MLHRDDKKTDVLQELIAEWIGEVGQLNIAVQQMPVVFKDSIAKIETDQEIFLGRMETYSSKVDQQLRNSFIALGGQYDALKTRHEAIKELIETNKIDNATHTQKVRVAVSQLTRPVASISDAIEKINGVIGHSIEVNSEANEILGGLTASTNECSKAMRQFDSDYQKFTEDHSDIFEFIIQSAAATKNEKERNEYTKSGLHELKELANKFRFNYTIAALVATTCFIVGVIIGKAF